MTEILILSVILIFVFALIVREIIKKIRYQKKVNQVPKNIRHSFIVFEKLYQDINGMNISLAERERLQLQDSSFTYGEITAHGFALILDVVQPKAHEIFYDLGCGTGKAVFCAALLNNWKKCVGIELLPALYQCCEELKEKFFTLPEVKKYFPEKKIQIEFYQQDLLQTDFSNADVVFTHATTFDTELWDSVKTKLNYLQSGARAIVVTKRLDEDCFELMNEEVRSMSWGECTVNIYKRR